MGLIDLFRPKYRHSNRNVRKAAVYKLTDEHLLAKIAKTDSGIWVRDAALRRLIDQDPFLEMPKLIDYSIILRAGVHINRSLEFVWEYFLNVNNWGHWATDGGVMKEVIPG
jgi:hypothetical protein